MRPGTDFEIKVRRWDAHFVKEDLGHARIVMLSRVDELVRERPHASIRRRAAQNRMNERRDLHEVRARARY
jgi:hypothetical protein